MNPEAPVPATRLFGGPSDAADSPSSQNSIAPFLPPLIPDHELIRLIGRGSYGQVWLAKNAVGTLRAIKVVYRATFEKAEHFEREFNGLKKFEPISRSYDGFVDILQLGRNDPAGYFYYVMELADDQNAERGTRNAELTASPETPHSALCTPDFYSPITLRDDLKLRGTQPL